MQIIMNQDEIVDAIEAYVTTQINIADGQKISVDFTNGRGPNGLSATLDIRSAAAKAKKPVTRSTTAQVDNDEPTPAPKKAAPEKAPEPVEETVEEEIDAVLGTDEKADDGTDETPEAEPEEKAEAPAPTKLFGNTQEKVETTVAPKKAGSIFNFAKPAE